MRAEASGQEYTYKMAGTCSREVRFSIESGKIHRVSFTDGCSGNLKGIALLAEGADARALADKLRGLRCGRKHTSCPDQLARAIEKALET